MLPSCNGLEKSKLSFWNACGSHRQPVGSSNHLPQNVRRIEGSHQPHDLQIGFLNTYIKLHTLPQATLNVVMSLTQEAAKTIPYSWFHFSFLPALVKILKYYVPLDLLKHCIMDRIPSQALQASPIFPTTCFQTWSGCLSCYPLFQSYNLLNAFPDTHTHTFPNQCGPKKPV